MKPTFENNKTRLQKLSFESLCQVHHFRNLYTSPYTDITPWWESETKGKRLKSSCCFVRKSKKNKTALCESQVLGPCATDKYRNILSDKYLADQQIRNLGRVWSAETGCNKVRICWLDTQTCTCAHTDTHKIHLFTIITISIGARIPPPSSASSKAYF